MLPVDTRIAIGNRIKDIRLSQGYTQSNFSEKLDISVNFLSEIETGKKGFSSETLYNLCDVFKVSSDEILFGSSDSSPIDTSIIDAIITQCNEMTSTQLSVLIDYLVALKNVRDNNLQ